MTRASIVIDNFNYDRFLGAAVDSALAQTHSDTEVVVVDDGSTDTSREVIAGYGDSILAVFKENGGQASAFNAGFAACSGEVICFLDADDLVDPVTMAAAVAIYEGTPYTKLHWPLRSIDAEGRQVGGTPVGAHLPVGDLGALVVSDGPDAYATSPTSGNAFSRTFLEQVLPMPEEYRTIGADAYLFALAALLGPLARLDEPHGAYRVHGTSGFNGLPFDERLRRGLWLHERLFAVLGERCHALGLEPQVERWHERSWYLRLQRAAERIDALVPPGVPFLLADEQVWGMEATPTRRVVPFLERDGMPWGPPGDDDEAIRELERERRAGVGALAFGWPSHWWLDFYAGFAEHLHRTARRAWGDEDVIVFELRPDALA